MTDQKTTDQETTDQETTPAEVDLQSEDSEAPRARRWLELSLAQHAVWVDARMTGPGSYQLGNWARISTGIDLEAFSQSISLLMARHDALRLRVDDAFPRQWMDSTVVPPVSFFDFAPRDLPLDADHDVALKKHDLAFKRHTEQAFARPMPLGDHPLFHVDLIRAGDSLYYMLWRFHHLIADSLSLWLTQRLWTGAYIALTSDTPTVLEPPSSYLPVVAADAAYCVSAACRRDAAYWASRFEPLPSPLLRPPESGRPGMVSASSELNADEVARFDLAAGCAGASLQRAVFALYALALSVRFGQADVVTGIALHRRNHDNRNTIGMFSGVLAVRCGFGRTATLLECVQQFSALMETDLRFQRLAVDEIARVLGLFRAGRARLYEATVSYLAAEHFRPDAALEGTPITAEVVTLSEASPLSLHLSELETTGAIAIKLTANTLHVDGMEAHAVHAIFRSAVLSFMDSPVSTVAQLAESISATHPDASANFELATEEWEF